jgi:hypothetical protein
VPFSLKIRSQRAFTWRSDSQNADVLLAELFDVETDVLLRDENRLVPMLSDAVILLKTRKARGAP